MPNAELIHQLRAKLESAEGLSEEARVELVGLLSKLEDPSDEAPHGLSRLTHYVEELEASHPELATVLGQIANVLSKMGI